MLRVESALLQLLLDGKNQIDNRKVQTACCRCDMGNVRLFTHEVTPVASNMVVLDSSKTWC